MKNRITRMSTIGSRFSRMPPQEPDSRLNFVSGPSNCLTRSPLEFQGKRHFHAFKTLLVHGGVPRGRRPDAGDNLADQHVLVPVFRQEKALISARDAAFQSQAVELGHGKLLRFFRNNGNIFPLPPSGTGFPPSCSRKARSAGACRGPAGTWNRTARRVSFPP